MWRSNGPISLYTDIKKYLLGASVAPSVANVPIIGWVAAGCVTIFSGNQGTEIGGGMAEDLNKNC